MEKIGLQTRIALQLDTTEHRRATRDNSLAQKRYQKAFTDLDKPLAEALSYAEEEPEAALVIAKLCSRFVLEAMPDPKQDGRRATALSQFQMLETCLKEIRRPDEYLANMREHFGQRLDPRNYPTGLDAFSSIIKSQRHRLTVEGQGFNTEQERNFCLKRSELLAAVERGYNRLRAEALGMNEPKSLKNM